MKRQRWTIVIVMIASLALAAAARQWAANARRAAAENPLLPLGEAGERSENSDAKLANMDSYALGLLLGGMRGPLVMFLWSSSETQKSEHNLEDFNTKIEWIRLLQPEFDTVHLYQIWNKAYNVSVQMANLPEKYASILDALDYANSVDRQRPDDINIIYDIAWIYGSKLGESHEAPYYIQRVRQDTMALRPQTLVTMPDSMFAGFMKDAHAAGMDQPNASAESNDTSQTVTVKIDKKIADVLRPKLESNDVIFRDLPPPNSSGEANVQRDRMDVLLDSSGNILPQYLKPTHKRPADWPDQIPYPDGSTLQFLAPYQPFPYGLSPQAISYNYYKRAQALQTAAHEDALQTSNFLIDRSPALELKFWGHEEAEEGRRAELRLYGADDSGDRITLDQAVPAGDPDHLPDGPPPATFADPAAGRRALAAYETAARVYADSNRQFQLHVQQFPRNLDTVRSHMADDVAFASLYQADHDFLDGILNAGQRSKSWPSAARQYTLAEQDFALIVLKFYIHDEVAAEHYPKDPATGKTRSKQTIDQIPPEQYVSLLKSVLKAEDDFAQLSGEYVSDRQEYLTYIRHCEGRLKLIAR